MTVYRLTADKLTIDVFFSTPFISRSGDTVTAEKILRGGEIEIIVENIVHGVYSDWFFKVFMVQVITAVHNNFEILFMFSVVLVKLSRITKNTYDDLAADFFSNLITKFKGVKK